MSFLNHGRVSRDDGYCGFSRLRARSGLALVHELGEDYLQLSEVNHSMQRGLWTLNVPKHTSPVKLGEA